MWIIPYTALDQKISINDCTWVDSWYTEIILFLQLSAYEVHVRPTLFFWSIIWLPWLREWGDLNKQLKQLAVATRKFLVSHTSMAFCPNECGRQIGSKSKTWCAIKKFFLKFHNGYFEGLHTTMEINKYVSKMNSFNKLLRCENHRKEVINMACKKCYRYNCLQCDEECTTTSCNGKYLQCVSFYSLIFPIRTD